MLQIKGLGPSHERGFRFITGRSKGEARYPGRAEDGKNAFSAPGGCERILGTERVAFLWRQSVHGL
jgi:hypothetical protein